MRGRWCWPTCAACRDTGGGSPGRRTTRASCRWAERCRVATTLPAMRVLLLANAYPSEKNPGFGAFVRRAADALAAQGVDVERAVLTTRARGRVRTPLKYAGLAALGVARGAAHRPDVVWSHYLVPTGTIAR